MRLDKLLANSGYGSRKDVKKLLKQRVVTVNGKIVIDGKFQVDSGTDVILAGNKRVVYKEFIYVMMNKPPGVISATEDLKEKTVTDLLPEELQKRKLHPVGRLDKDTVGLLLLTNNGNLSHQLLSPKKHVPKTYFAVIDRQVTAEDVKLFEQGVRLDDGYQTEPAILEIEKSGSVRSEVLITITEGKFHQVKRMFTAVHKMVVYLKRISMGPLFLDESLQEGEFRELTDEEIRLLEDYGGR